MKEEKSICTSTIRFLLILPARVYKTKTFLYQFIEFTSDSFAISPDRNDDDDNDDFVALKCLM